MKKLIPALLFGALFVPGAQGSITTYTSRSAYESALISPTTFDFNDADGPIFMLGPNITVTSLGPGSDANGRIVSQELQASQGGLPNPNYILQFSFLTPDVTPNYAFGYDNLDLTDIEEAVVTFSFANGDPSQQFIVNLGGQPEFAPIFFGAVSTEALSNVQIFSRDIGTSNILLNSNIVDNVTIGDVAPVADAPEPSSIFLMSGGLLILVGRFTKTQLARARK